MRIPGLKTLCQSVRWVRSRFGKRALILGYHRIAEVDHDPLGLCVSDRNFSEQMEVVRQIASPIGLQDLTKGLSTKNFPEKAVVVTFDDGYADILNHSLPVLEYNRVPATVFIVTGYMGKSFLWDIQEYQKSTLVSQDLGYLRALSVEETIKLAHHGLIEVGAHSVSHPKLSELPVEKQRVEVLQSKQKLEEIIGRAVTSFSYPNGLYSKYTPSIVREVGYLCACTSVNDVVRHGCDPFQLPRFWVQNWDGETFSRWLSYWLSG
jgi:peptidoglycan/xylan/chitin deacetylase (PgdA/CDA1 family)